MSGAITGAGGFPGVARAISGMNQTRQRLDTLTGRASSGLISNTYAGLGGTASIALALAPQIEALRVAGGNIDAASGPAQVAQTAMTRVQAIAADLLARLPQLQGASPAEVETIAANARSSLAEVASLLNSQYGGVYVFAGQDTANPPVPDAGQIAASGFFTQIAAAVGNLSSAGAAATAAATLATAGSNAAGTSPFSAYLSQPAVNLSPPSVATGDGQSRTIGLLASANSHVTSPGNGTTGSYMRDLMRALATVGSLSGAQVNDANFGALVSGTQSSLTGAIGAMAADVGILGEQQAALTATRTRLSDTATALTGQLSSARDADMAATLSDLSFTQTRLQASYQLISTLSGLSLAKFLPAG